MLTNPIAPLCFEDFFGASFDTWSKLSCPLIISKIVLASSVVFVSGPITSNDIAKSSSPYLETAPYVGFNPTTPQCEAGFLIEPPVSEPSVKSAKSAAIAAAGPEDEPPEMSLGFVGFFVGPKLEVSPEAPEANSSIFNIPKRIASSARSLFTTVALNGPV